MIQCQNCRKSNPDGNEYCGHCGSKLVQSNPHPIERKYPPGKEPEEVKRLLKAFLVELHREFPDHIIDYSRWNHEKWDKPAKYLCKHLEYKGLASMLRAYGFRIKRSSSTNDDVQSSDAAEKRLSDDKLPQKDHIRKIERKKKSKKKWYVTAGIFAVIILVVCLLMLRSCVNKQQATDVAGEWVLDGILRNGNTIHGAGDYEYCNLRLSNDGIVNYLADPQNYGMIGLYHQSGTDGHGQLLYTVLLPSDGEDVQLTMIYSPEADSLLLLQSENDGLIFARSAKQAENQNQVDNHTEDEETAEYEIHDNEVEFYISNCQSEVSTRTMVRYSEQYLGRSYKFVVQVFDIFDDGVLHLITDENNDGFCADGYIYAKDCRTFDTTKILEGDILIIYGDYVGVSKDDIVCMKVYYAEILGADATGSYLPETSVEQSYPTGLEPTGYPAYDQKIAEYYSAALMNEDSFFETYGGDYSSINSLIVSYYHSYGGMSLCYTLYDVDKNGVPELIFSDGNNIIDIYTLKNNLIVKLFDDCYFGERSRLHILSDGRLLSEGSSGASSGSCEICRIDSDGATITTAGALYYDGNGRDSYMDATHSYTSTDEYLELINTWLADSIFDELSWTVIISS